MRIDSPWVIVAVGFPVLNGIYLTAVITALKTVEHAATGYKMTYLQKVYADGCFKIVVAAAFLVVGPVVVSAYFDPLYLLLAPLGIGIYTAQNRLWQWYSGVNPAPMEQNITLVVPLLLAPAAEEIIFRGGIGLLIETAGPAVFLAVSATTFALSHLFSGKKEVVFKFFDGILYGVIFLGTGSLLAPILVHVAHNFTYAYMRGLL